MSRCRNISTNIAFLVKLDSIAKEVRRQHALHAIPVPCHFSEDQGKHGGVEICENHPRSCAALLQ
jgi:hypothetical protein